MNYFAPKNTADRYARGRPRFHANTIRRIQDRLSVSSKLSAALDVACGTGLSTEALLPIAERVHGIDLSEEMLKYASKIEGIQVQKASAEELPFPDHIFDLITVSSGVHWFDIDKFLLEVSRVLKLQGNLVIYENYFAAIMEGHDSFHAWVQEKYLHSFPAPPRNRSYAWDNDTLAQFDLQLIYKDRFQNLISFTKPELILYFTTQSNISHAVEVKGMKYPDIESYLNKELDTFYSDGLQQNTLQFGNWIMYISRV